MKILAVGGAGHIGSCGVRQLRSKAPDAEIVIADYDPEKAGKLAAEVGGRTTAVRADAGDIGALAGIMRTADVVINTCGPFYRYGESVLKAAIEAGRNIVDICDDADATEKMLKLDAEAKRAGICAVVGLGATPGITNVMARAGADQCDRVDEVDTAWAWSALDPKMTGSAIVDHVFHAITGEVATYRDGGWRRIPAWECKKTFDFMDPVGKFEVAQVGHPEPVTIPRYLKGVRSVTNYGGIWPEKFAVIAALFKELGIASLTEIDVKGKRIPARDIASAIFLAIGELNPALAESLRGEATARYGEFGIEGLALRVDVAGEKNGKRVRFSYTSGAATDLLTSLPSVIGALMLARGQIRGAGVFAPEGIVETKTFFSELVKDIPVRALTDQPLDF